jgi:hypothetical protein
MKSCGYVLAGFETLATILDNFIAGRRGRFNDNFTREQVSDFLSRVTAGFLHSYGQDFPNKKKYHKYNQREGNLYKICRDMRVFDGCTMIADSGGFQISIGKLSRRESELLYNMYYEWLVDYKDAYDKAFILDIPPGPGCEIFHNFDDVYNKNLESYQRAKNLPDDVRKKLIYVHHFRTPQLWNIYTKIMRDYEMFNAFEYHSTGGIVANMGSDMIIPCIIYVIPLVPLIKEAMKYGRDYLNFHILGGANFRDVFFYELFKKVVKKKHNFDLNITYDSSGIFKQVMHARFIYVKDPFGNYRKMDIRSNNMNYKFLRDVCGHDKLNSNDIAEQEFNKFADKWNFKHISVDGMYDPDRNTFWEDIKVYSMLYTLDLYCQIQNEMAEFAEKIYPLYESGDHLEFNNQCLNMTKVLNQGKLTKKQRVKSKNIIRSLDILSTLNEKHCHDIVNQYLSKDEFIELDDKTRVLTI